MLGEISSETALQGLASQAPSVMSNRPAQASPPVGEELAKPMDFLQVIALFTCICKQTDITSWLPEGLLFMTGILEFCFSVLHRVGLVLSVG